MDKKFIFKIWFVLVFGITVSVEGHGRGPGSHSHGVDGNSPISASDVTWTAPAVKCGNTTQNENDFATCELLLSTISDALDLQYGTGTPPPNVFVTDNATSNSTSNSTSGKTRFYEYSGQNKPNVQRQQPLDEMQNDVCCFLLNFEPMRTRCCKQLSRFCEATGGRPNACKCAGTGSGNLLGGVGAAGGGSARGRWW